MDIITEKCHYLVLMSKYHTNDIIATYHTVAVEVFQRDQVISGSAQAAVTVVCIYANVMATTVVNLALVVQHDGT